MDRRLFLKGIVILMPPLIASPDISLMPPDYEPSPGQSWFSDVREMSGYDMGRDLILYQWDLFAIAKNDQPIHLVVCARGPADGIQALRRDAERQLTLAMYRDGIRPYELAPRPC